MEFFFEVVLELLFQFIAEIGVEFGSSAVSEGLRKSGREKNVNPVLAVMGLIILSALIGGITSFVFPKRILPQIGFSGVSLIISPLATGLVMHMFGKWRRNSGYRTSYLATFIGGASFAFGISATRWICITYVVNFFLG